ncbi:hypothetical protein [Helicobacter bilis]|uniref:hypothetical protein n=1 Tax=Helicobacter bilis TaxID=37372 RepID=UPI0026EEEB8A|nr:hypothetical protein [Helicobacter bilis]MCI7410651.1 hypothetical protein [Helicobacter bilis]MDD7295689.1 hypothetical protein [Helicobacter bilis]MDY4400132.1 hypothetical protein [Helicobacter bilis]
MRLLRIFLFSVMICGGLRAEGIPYGCLNVLQIASFHYGFSTDLNKTDSDKVAKDRFSGIVGISVGWNFFGDMRFNPEPTIPIPFTHYDMSFGLRAKYLFMNSYAPTHSVGGMLYIYPSRGFIGTLNLIIGVGANFSQTHNLKANGAYIEVGLGLLKISPLLVNTDITYRANIYGRHNDLDLWTIHSLNFVWTFF